MEPAVKRVILKPRYYDSFSCCGASCEDNCCKDWGIIVDKKTYTEYRRVADADLRKKLEKYVKRIRSDSPDYMHYAKFVLDENRTCYFQTEDKLCEIQLKLGERYLSHTCQVYPRLQRAMSEDSEHLELSLTMSCPEAVRAALFNPEPMEFDLTEEELRRDSPFVRVNPTTAREGKKKTSFIEHGWLMRDASIDIMQDRKYSIAHRIILIGMMLSKAVRLHEEDQGEKIPGIIEMYRAGTAGGEFSSSLLGISPKEETRKQMAAMMYRVVLETTQLKRSSYGAFHDLISRFSAFLSSSYPNADKNNIEKAAPYFDLYIGGLSSALWEDFFKNWNHVLENYLVNYMFCEIFPLKYHEDGFTPYDHALLLAEQYALLKLLLLGNHHPKEGFSPAFITRIISQVATLNQHSKSPMSIVTAHKRIGVDGLGFLYHILI